MLAESEGRVLIVARRRREPEVVEIFRKWDLDGAVIGKVTGSGRIRVLESGRVVADLPIAPLTEGAPVYDRPLARPRSLDELQRFDPLSLGPPKDLAEALLKLLSSPTISSKEAIYTQYDHMVRLGGVPLPGKRNTAVVS